MIYQSAPYENVTLRDGELLRRRAENRKYLMELDNDKLLLHYRFEAGRPTIAEDNLYGGWEDPLCQLRGHFLGHWLSAAAFETAATGDGELRAKAEAIVFELAKCQQDNGGEWCASIPEKYLTLIAQGKAIWAPQYTIHKTFMGLLDQYSFCGNQQALDIAVNFSKWFYRWSAEFDEESFARILDVETGGMLEIWVQLYEITGDDRHKELMDRYYRRSLFDGLLQGRDVLTNMHANTTIPEVLGAAKAYEVTGEAKWMDIVKAYWDQAVTVRGAFCTGGQTDGEIWTPKMQFSARLGEKNQEHCTVYNMMRLADFLFRHTGEREYADYWETNLYNGIMAQAYYRDTKTSHGAVSPYPDFGLLSYFLPLKSGGIKPWASKTNDFFCCHGSMVQANAGHTGGIYYYDSCSLAVNQYIASDLSLKLNDQAVRLQQRTDSMTGNDHMTGSMTGSQTINDQAAAYAHHPAFTRNVFNIECEAETEFTLRLRVPGWCNGQARLYINGEQESLKPEKGYFVLNRRWKSDTLTVEFQKDIYCVSLPGEKETAAFMYGPVVLAGLTKRTRLYAENTAAPESILIHDNEREWSVWLDTFRTKGQEQDISFVPLYQIGYEPYTVYFSIAEKH